MRLSLLFAVPALVATLPAQHQVPVNGVPQRVDFAIAYDTARGTTLLFGGSHLSTYNSYDPSAFHGDTWLRDAGGWRYVRPPTSPAPRSAHTMAFDAARQRTVLYGGFVAVSGPPNSRTLVDETWEHDGTTWQLRPTAHHPPVSTYQRMVFDLARQRLVWCGYRNTSPTNSLETWEYDGVDWQQANPSGAGPIDVLGALAYAPARQRLVLCGLHSGSPTSSFETWEYDGASWQLVPTAHVPLQYPGSACTTATDTNGQILLQAIDFATGPQHVTWRYDGVDWQPVATAHQPTGWWQEQLVYDTARGRHVLYNGKATWEFDGVDWTLAESRLLPEQRGGAVALADPARGRILLYGGYRDGVGVTSELVAWSGPQWQPLPAAVSPPPRLSPVLAFDTRRDRIVMHGGGSQTDTWEYDGATWRQIVTATTPWPALTAMAYDPVRGRCVAYGADYNPPFTPSNTWFFDGTDWQLATTAHQPPPRHQPVLTYDATHDVVAMYGGAALGTLTVRTDTWWLQDGDWRQQNPQVRPPVAYAIGAGDAARGRFVVATGATLGTLAPGGWYEYDGQRWSPLPVADGPWIDYVSRYVMVDDPATGRLLTIGVWGDVWAYQPPPLATFAALGTGCANGPAPRLGAAPGSTPQLGGAFTVQITGLPAAPGALFVAYGFDFASFQGAALPQELGWLGLPGCFLWLAPSGLGAFVAHAGGSASHTLALPANVALAGTRFLLQALQLDASAPAGVGAPSNAGIATAY